MIGCDTLARRAKSSPPSPFVMAGNAAARRAERKPLPASLFVLELVFLIDLAVGLVRMRRGFASPERSRHKRFARSQGVALRGPCGDLLAGHCVRFADEAP